MRGAWGNAEHSDSRTGDNLTCHTNSPVHLGARSSGRAGVLFGASAFSLLPSPLMRLPKAPVTRAAPKRIERLREDRSMTWSLNSRGDGPRKLYFAAGGQLNGSSRLTPTPFRTLSERVFSEVWPEGQGADLFVSYQYPTQAVVQNRTLVSKSNGNRAIPPRSPTSSSS